MKTNNSDELIDLIRNSSVNMSFDEYSNATGIAKEYISKILTGEIEQVDEDTRKRLFLE